MPAWLLGQVVVTDAEAFQPYVRETSALIAEHGGEVVDVTRATETLEGSWPEGALTALVRFPDLASLRAFWESPGNARMKSLRRGAAASNVAICVSIATPPPTRDPADVGGLANRSPAPEEEGT